MRTYALLCFAMAAAISSAHAQNADLTLPPELRAGQPSQMPAPADEYPAKQTKAKKPAKAAAKQETQPAPSIPAATASKPRNAADENPLSLGMSWKANNTPDGATRATSGLVEDNKNHDGEAAGIGAKLGLGYKF